MPDLSLSPPSLRKFDFPYGRFVDFPYDRRKDFPPYHPDWLEGWSYRRPVDVTEESNNPLTNYQVKIELPYGFDYSKAQANGEDVRFTDEDGVTLLDYWKEGWKTSCKLTNSGATHTPPYPTLNDGSKLHFLYMAHDESRRVNGNAPWVLVYGEYDYITYPTFDKLGLTLRLIDLQAIETVLGVNFVNWGSLGRGISIITLNSNFYIIFWNLINRESVVLKFNINGGYLAGRYYGDARFSAMCVVNSKIYAAELVASPETGNKFVEINADTLEYTTKVTISEAQMGHCYGMVGVSAVNKVYLGGRPTVAEAPRCGYVDLSTWTYTAINVSIFGSGFLCSPIYCPYNGYIYWGGYTNTKGYINTSDNSAYAWDVGTFGFSVFPLLLDVTEKIIVVGGGGSATGATQRFLYYYYETNTYSDKAKPSGYGASGGWVAVYPFLGDAFVMLGNEGHYNTPDGQFYLDLSAVSWTSLVTEFDNLIKRSVFWVELLSIGALETKRIYLYYGNPVASDGSDGDATFQFLDDFLGSSLDLTKWSVDAGYTYSVSGSKLRVTGVPSGSMWLIQPFHSLWSVKQNSFLVEARGVSWNDGNANSRLGNWGPTVRNGAAFDNVLRAYVIDSWIASTGRVDCRIDTNTWLGAIGSLPHIGSAKFVISKDQNNNVRIYWDDVLKLGPIVSTATILEFYLKVGGNPPTNPFYDEFAIDLVFIRGYVSPEPTHGDWGSEETY